MKFLFAGVAVALAVAPSVAQAQTYGTPTPPAPPAQPAGSIDAAIKTSPQASKAIQDLQTAVIAKDVANIPAKVAAAQAVAKTKADNYWIARMQLKAAVDANDYAAAQAAIDAISATGLLPQSQIVSFYAGLGGSEFNAKQYAAAATAFGHVVALDPNNLEAIIDLGRSQAAAGQGAEAVTALKRAIELQSTGGKKPDENLLKQAVGVAYNAKLPSALDFSREWVTNYPSPHSWHDAIAIYRNLSHQDDESTLELLRLMQATGAMNSAGDYSLFAQAAERQRHCRGRPGGRGAQDFVDSRRVGANHLERLSNRRTVGIGTGARDEVDQLPPAHRHIAAVASRLVEDGQQAIVETHRDFCP
jgi:tetratricopeptide (TPR) repeat protein